MPNTPSLLYKINLTKHIPIFSKLKWHELHRIARRAIVVEYKKGIVIRKEGDAPDFFYCIVSGRVQVYSQGEFGNKNKIDYLHRGMHFGVISLLTGENHSLTYEAINDSVLLQIPVQDFRETLQHIPQLGLELSQILSQRLRRQVKGTKNVFESKVVSIYSPVKGTGSSTYSINLAINIQKETHKKVIYVNIHANGKHGDDPESSHRWKIVPVNLLEVLGDYEKITANIIKGDLEMDMINVQLDPTDPSVRRQISPFISTLVGDYHYVVVDLPNDMDDVVLETLAQSDTVHLLTSDRRKDLEEINKVIERLKQELKEYFRPEKVHVLIRAFHSKMYLSFEEISQAINFLVYRMLPTLEEGHLHKVTSAKCLDFCRCDSQSEYARTVRTIAREIGGVLVGLVLGGGAALGVAHIGVIKVLEEENIPIDVVVGSSMGALIAAIWTTGRNWEQIRDVAAEFEKKGNMIKLFDPVIPISGLMGGRAISLWLRKHLGSKSVHETNPPLKIVAYDLVRREEMIISTGSLVDAVRQSIAIPGVIEPVCHKEKVIIDGGVLNPLPTNVLSHMGIKRIIAVNVLQSPSHASEGYDLEQSDIREKLSIPFTKAPFHYVMFRVGRWFVKLITPNISDIIVRTLQATEYVIAEQSAQLGDVVIRPDLVGIQWYELDKYKELIQRGEEAARRHLHKIKELVQS